jgi:outer membrane protein assembly complex protein YaeT
LSSVSTNAAAGLFAALVILAAGAAAADVAETAAPEAGFELEIRGLAAFDAESLRRAAAEELADFAAKGFRRADIDDAAFQMERALRRAGFAFAEVAYRITETAGPPRVVFEVSEGPRVGIAALEITGHAAFERRELEAFFARGGDRPPAPGEAPFVRAEIDAGIADLADFYREQGFADVRVDGPEIRFSPDRTQATVRVRVSEGVRRRVAEILFSGEGLEAAGEGLAALNAEFTGRPLAPRLTTQIAQRVEELFADRGFADVSVRVRERPAEAAAGEPGAVRLEVAVDPGEIVTVSQVSVRGHAKTRESFIRRRLALAPGDRTSRAKERESARELARTGLFSRVRVALERGAGGPGRVLVVEVAEAPSRELYLEPGWGAYEALRLKTGFREKNLLGRGIAVGAEAKASLKERSVSGALTDPWIGGADTAVHASAHLLEREEPAFTRNEIGAGLTVSRRFSATLTASAGYSLRTTELADVGAQSLSQGSGEDYDLGSLTLQATRDTRDDIFFATRGDRTHLSAELAAPFLGGDVAFLRLTGGARLFLGLGGDTVLALRAATGLIAPGGGDDAVPISERFFNGGENSVRSFHEAELGPQGASGDPAGGYGMNLLSAELRRRLVGNLCGSLFADLGNLSPGRSPAERGRRPYASRRELLEATLSDFFEGFRPAVGVGLQLLTPVGPARLDLAVNPDRDARRGEESAVIHFSVGMAF